MAEEKFEVFVTVDRNLPYQQNLQRLPVAIFVLCAFNNRRETLKMLIPKIFEQISMGATADLRNLLIKDLPDISVHPDIASGGRSDWYACSHTQKDF